MTALYGPAQAPFTEKVRRALIYEGVLDSTDILLRPDELPPEPPLLCVDPKVAQRQRELEDWTDASCPLREGPSA